MIKQVGPTTIKETHTLSCHCGAVKLALSLPNGIEKPRRSDSTEYGYNVGCLEEVNPFDLGDITTMDGVHHPADRSGAI